MRTLTLICIGIAIFAAYAAAPSSARAAQSCIGIHSEPLDCCPHETPNGWYNCAKESQEHEEKYEAAQNAHMAALVQQSKPLERYIQILPEVTAFINRVKALEANYLADNSSVSSVPRNARALFKKHADWLTGVQASSLKKKPTIDAVNSASSYRDALNTIAAFEESCPNDASISASEHRFLADLQRLPAIISSLQIAGQKQADALNDPTISGTGDQTLLPNIRSYLQALPGYSAALSKVADQVRGQASIRSSLCQTIAQNWHQSADYGLHQANATGADALIASINDDLRGPRIYAMVNAATASALRSVDAPLRDFYTPIHAQRAFFAAKSFIAKLRDTARKAQVTADMRTEISANIDQFEADLTSRKGSVDDAVARKEDLGNERQRLIKLVLAYNAAALTADCSKLANAIVGASVPSDDPASEQDYINFKTKCSQQNAG